VTKNDINEIIFREEIDGEKLICRLRLALAFVFFGCVLVISWNKFPPRAYICCSLFLIYSVCVYFYLRKREAVHYLFKYVCVILDMIILSAGIWIGFSYPAIAAGIPCLSIWALFLMILVMAGAFRHSVRCAWFSGIFAGICYLVVVIANAPNIEMLYFIAAGGKIPAGFPVLMEIFRVMAMVVTGIVSGMAGKRCLSLFNEMVISRDAAAGAALNTVGQTRSIAAIIRKSSDEIFLSSKDIFSTAGSQAVSVQKIENTINRNMQIAVEVAEKTQDVAAIASKMENDVIYGFVVLERNVDQLEEIKNENDKVISGIITLGNKIIKIREIVKTINTIANQTKVIAFNAALEAAGAGEQGKRFSVVANEVNRLAEDITALTVQIRDQVEEILGSSSALIVSSEESADKIAEEINLIKELEDVFREIRSSAEITANQAQKITASSQTQQKSTKQVTVAISGISGCLSSFIQSTKVANSSAEGLAQKIQELDSLLIKREP